MMMDEFNLMVVKVCITTTIITLKLMMKRIMQNTIYSIMPMLGIGQR